MKWMRSKNSQKNIGFIKKLTLVIVIGTVIGLMTGDMITGIIPHLLNALPTNGYLPY